VRLRNAGGDAGVFIEGDADASITALSCARCSAPVLAYGCNAKVASSDVRAEEGTEKVEVRMGCP